MEQAEEVVEEVTEEVDEEETTEEMPVDPKDKKIVEKVQARQKKKIKFQICLW